MAQYYDNRNTNASVFVTDLGAVFPYDRGMLTKDELLTELRARGVSQAAIARAIGKPTPRVNELYAGGRNLKYEEGVALIEAFLPELSGAPVNAKTLAPILAACLRNAPKGGWTEQEAEYLAEAVQYGLQLVSAVPANQASSDALAVAGRAASDRLHKALS